MGRPRHAFCAGWNYNTKSDMRRHLRLVVLAWLLCQAGALAAAPLAFTASAVPVDAEHVVCTCPGALPGAACPMHHPDAQPRKSGGFLLQNPCAPSPAAMLFLAGGLGLPAMAPVTIALDLSVEPVVAAVAALVSHTDVPDAPPPRS
jgi:hypothetical protein